MKVFFTNYHISVNDCFVDDLSAIGLEVILPSIEFAKGRIDFFAPNDQHRGKPGVKIVEYDEYMAMEPMAIILSCDSLKGDFMKLYHERGDKDTIVLLTAKSNSETTFALEGNDFVISHDLIYHRLCKAKYKILYFNRPTVFDLGEKDYRKAYDEKKINLYVNNFMQERFNPEREKSEKFRELWGRPVPFYGYGMKDGWLSMEDTQKKMQDSMFTLVFKRPETWGQMVNESMLQGTPCIFLREFMIYSAFKEYLITPDTAIVGDTVEELVARINSLSFEEYDNLCFEAKKMSEMFTEKNNRLDKLRWLFSKVQLDLDRKKL